MYLGIHLDKRLLWNIHVNKFGKNRNILFKIKPVLNIFQLKTMYHDLVELLIGVKYIIKLIQTIQVRFFKIIYDTELSHPSNNLYNEIYMLDSRKIYIYNLLIHQ